MCNLLVKKGALLMNNLKILWRFQKRSGYIFVVLLFLSFISFLSLSQRVFAADAPKQAAKEAPAPGVELPQFESGQSSASATQTTAGGQPAAEAGTATAAVGGGEGGAGENPAGFWHDFL